MLIKSKILIGLVAVLMIETFDVYGQNEIISDDLQNLDPPKIQIDENLEYFILGITLIIIITLILKKQTPLGPRKFRV